MKPGTDTQGVVCQGDMFGGMDFLPLGILAVDRSFRIIFWNTCLESWTGLGREQLLGKDIRDVSPRWPGRWLWTDWGRCSTAGLRPCFPTTSINFLYRLRCRTDRTACSIPWPSG